MQAGGIGERVGCTGSAGAGGDNGAGPGARQAVWKSGGVLLRDRFDDDLAGCVELAARRDGVGRRLLAHGSQQAVSRGLWPVLDVAADLTGAIRLYESCGWVGAGAVTVTFRDGNSLDELVYLGPPPGR